MQHIKHIIWDWNGTLLNDLHVSVAAINEVLVRRGIAPVDEKKYREIYQHPIENIYRALGLNFSEEEFIAASELWHTKYQELLRGAFPFKDVSKSLEVATKHGKSQSLLSALPHSTLTSTVKKHKLKDHFLVVLGLSDIFGRSKVENGHLLLNQLSTTYRIGRDEVLLVGDSTHDFEVATALSIPCALICRGYESKERLTRHGNRIWDSVDSFVNELLELTPIE